jgi:hypothetical protein
MDVTPFDRRSFLRRTAVTAGGLAVGSMLARPGGAWAAKKGVPRSACSGQRSPTA